MNYKKLLVVLLGMSMVVNPFIASAQEITVSGNGDSSSNTVNVTSSQAVETQQQNTAQIENNIAVNANTGNNSTNENTGETNIATGDINVSSNIDNQNINSNYVAAECCNGGETNVNVSGNGTNSNNSVNYSTDTNNNISVNNNASINNSAYGNVNTGYNTANDNQGNVSITTGDIRVIDNIRNNGINIYEIAGSLGNTESVYIKIKGNANESTNAVDTKTNNDLSINIVNEANIENNSDWELNTGNNEANDNNGDAMIATGDIYFTSSISNTDINVGLVDVDCCDSNPDNPKTPDINPPPASPDSGNNNGSSNNTNNSVSASNSGPVLPVTGGFSLIFLALINIFMFFTGAYLRLRSGNSPSLAKLV